MTAADADADANPASAAAHWAAVRALFDEVVALPAAHRAGFLAAVTAPAAVLAEVRSLLAHAADDDGADDGFLQPPAALRAAMSPGQRLGPWEVVGPLGHGGMGEVFEARRADGSFDARVAVKLLRSGLDSAAVLQRFAQEQRVLARLNHPHIARLLDAGRTADGRPYFVMELVAGVPIDRACEGRPLAQRLALFLQLADAVAHAHRQLLLHRDLKPGNALVTAEGEVKLLDFGIAKAIDPLETGDGSATLLGERPFTPHYASPEQVRGEPVGTATDVYSLGVLLYVMLTGARPYGRDATTSLEAARCVLEEPPRRPSTTVPALRGDLDNILLKALAKAPDDRYPSVDAFAADIRAHLAGRPVAARPQRLAYLAGRFVRRNRVAVAAATLAALALVGGTAVALWQAQVADAQRAAAQQRFTQVRQLANQLVFKYHDQIELLPGATPVREALLADAAQFLDNLHQGSDDDPQLAHELANTYYRISRLQGVARTVNTGQHDLAEANLDKAIALTRRYVDRPGVTVQTLAEAVNMRTSKGEQWQRHGQMARADAALQEAQPLLERALKQAPQDTWALTSAIAFHGVRSRIQASLVHASLGRWKTACASADQARAAAQATLQADPANIYGPDSLAFAIGEQGQCLLLAGRAAEAQALFTEQRTLCDRNAERFPQDMDFRYQRAAVRANLARALAAQGRHAEARRELDDALAIGRAALVADPRNAAGQQRVNTLVLLSLQLLVDSGDASAARAQADAALQGLAAGPKAPFVDARWRAEALLWAARAWRSDQPRRALAWADEAESLMRPARADDDNATRRWMQALAQGERAQALAALGEREAAARAAAEALQTWGVAGGTEAGDGPPPALAASVEAARALLSRAGP